MRYQYYFAKELMLRTITFIRKNSQIMHLDQE